MKRSRLVLSLVAASWLAPLAAAAEAVQVDAGIPAYQTVSGVARTSPTGPHNHVHTNAATINANGVTPVLDP